MDESVTENRFGIWLRQHLRQCGKAEAELVNEINASPVEVERWLSGNALPGLPYMAPIARALGILEITVRTALRQSFYNKPMPPLRRYADLADEMMARAPVEIPVTDGFPHDGSVVRGSVFLPYIPGGHEMHDGVYRAFITDERHMEPAVAAGDLVIIDIVVEIEVGDVVACDPRGRNDNVRGVMRLIEEGNDLFLRSDGDGHKVEVPDYHQYKVVMAIHNLSHHYSEDGGSIRLRDWFTHVAAEQRLRQAEHERLQRHRNWQEIPY